MDIHNEQWVIENSIWDETKEEFVEIKKEFDSYIIIGMVTGIIITLIAAGLFVYYFI